MTAASPVSDSSVPPAVLEVVDLSVEFATPGAGRAAGPPVRAVTAVRFSLAAGETLAILGESGSGKSVTAQAAMGLVAPPGRVTGGVVRLSGQDLLARPEAERRRLRGTAMAMIFQDPLSALNPVFTVGFQIAEMFRVHQGMRRREANARAVELLDRVRIPSAALRAREYPHQFSGGMRQRAMIAMAIALDPAVLLADEPTTALDVTVQAQILDLLAQLQAETGMGVVLITHDIGVAAETADRVAVMYAGRVVETGPAEAVLTDPRHPYTAGLLASLPQGPRDRQRLEPIRGAPPSLSHIPAGCAFHPRCPHATDRCRVEVPPLAAVGIGRGSACLRVEEVFGAPG